MQYVTFRSVGKMRRHFSSPQFLKFLEGIMAEELPACKGLPGFLFYFILRNQYSYSDYLGYDERPHLHVGYPTPKPVSASLPLVMNRIIFSNPAYKNLGKKIMLRNLPGLARFICLL